MGITGTSLSRENRTGWELGGDLGWAGSLMREWSWVQQTSHPKTLGKGNGDISLPTLGLSEHKLPKMGK